ARTTADDRVMGRPRPSPARAQRLQGPAGARSQGARGGVEPGSLSAGGFRATACSRAPIPLHRSIRRLDGEKAEPAQAAGPRVKSSRPAKRYWRDASSAKPLSLPVETESTSKPWCVRTCSREDGVKCVRWRGSSSGNQSLPNRSRCHEAKFGTLI